MNIEQTGENIFTQRKMAPSEILRVSSPNKNEVKLNTSPSRHLLAQNQQWKHQNNVLNPVNPFVHNPPLFYPLKTTENRNIFCFQGLEKGYIENKWVNVSNEDTRLMLMTPFSVFTVTFEQISQIALAFSLLTFNK